MSRPSTLKDFWFSQQHLDHLRTMTDYTRVTVWLYGVQQDYTECTDVGVAPVTASNFPDIKLLGTAPASCIQYGGRG